MRNYIKNILTVWFLISGTAAFAGELQPITGILKSTNSHPVELHDSVEIYIDTAANAKDYRVKNIISLLLDQNTDTFLTTAISVKVQLIIYRWNRLGVAMPTRTEYLTVFANNRYNRQTIDRASLKLDDGYRVIVEINDIIINGSGPIITLPRFVSIEPEIRLERYFDFSGVVNDPVTDIGIDSLNTDCSEDSSIDELKIHWGVVPEAEEYQLEWIYVNDYGADTASAYSAASLTADFKNNSTRITTASANYRIALTYERGYIAFRIRAVGRDYLNPGVWMYSVWSEADMGTVSAVDAGAVYYNWRAHEKSKNWQYSVTFAEEGKKKEVISYFDGSLHNRQSVTKINSDKNAIVGETLYDFQGRPAINVLPAPVTFPECVTSTTTSALKYYPKYNRNLIDSAYSKTDFDLDAETGECNPFAPGMDTTAGASLYYSGNNPDKSFQQAFVPDAELYPFSQVEYTPDNTGRIRSQSGVGKKFQLGSNHETKYLYGQPNQIQLDRLFGSEAGDASHYKKNVVLDANGQASVSYMNQEGKTIATALAGNPPVESSEVYMEELGSAINAADTLSVDLFNKNSSGASLLNKITPLQDGIEFSTQILVSYNSTYKFNYDLSVTAFEDPCLLENICMSCIYDLEIKVADECGNDLTYLGTHDEQPIHKVLGHLDSIPNGFTMTCSDPSGTTVADSISIDLSPGVYTVSKVLTINKDARDFYVRNYFDTIYNSCALTLNDFIDGQMANLDTSACSVSCSSCAAALGTKDDYVSSGKGTELQYDLLYEACLAPCKEKTLCETSFDMMVMDMSPGGQYGDFDPATFTAANPVSVFNTNNRFNGNRFAISTPQNWKHPKITINGTSYGVYVNSEGIRTPVNVVLNSDLTTYTPEVDDPSKVYTDPDNGELFTYPENLKKLSDFIPVWDPYFARSLVIYHPEYAYYKACSTHAIIYPGDTLSSDQFDSLLMATQTFDEAVANGFIKNTYEDISVAPNDKVYDYLNYSSGNIYDPFFSNTNFGLLLLRPDGGFQSMSHSALYGLMDGKFQNFVNIAGTSYSMVETAAFLSRCGNNFSALPTGACMGFGTDYFDSVVVNYQHMNDSVRNKEWQMLKTFYLSEKRKIQFDRMDFYARYYNWTAIAWEGGCNACIGNPSYSVATSGMFLPYLFSSYPSAPSLNPKQPCSILTSALYANTQKRFISPTNSGLSTGDVPYMIYQATGQCPMAFLLQNFLNSMAQDSLLNSTTPVDLNTVSTFTIDMYNALNGTSTPSMFINYKWDQDAIVGDVLSVDIKNPDTGTPVCSLQLDISGTGIGGFQNVTGIQNLTYDSIIGDQFYFNAVAIYSVGDTATATANITGSSCLNIKDCNFTEPCHANQFASDLQNLMSIIAMNGHILAADYNISRDTLISPFITTTIKNMLGTPNSTLMWDFTAPQTFDIYDSTNSSTKIRLTSLSLTPSVPITDVQSYGNIRSDYFNQFKVDLFDTAGIMLAVLGANANLVTPSGTSGISMGECGFEAAPECSLKEHRVRTDLEKLLNEALTRKPLPGSINFFDRVNFSSLLQSYLSADDTSTVTISSGTANGIDSLILGTSSGYCSLTLRHALGVVFDSVISVTDLTGTGTVDANGNFHDFYFVAMYDSLGTIITDTVTGTSCWPLKNCDHCDSTTVTPVASDENTVSIPTAYTGWSPMPTEINTVDTSECMISYAAFTDALNNYNASVYASHHHDTLNPDIYPNAVLLMNAGYCNCVDAYITYLNNYLDEDTTSVLPLPADIDHFEGCAHVVSNDDLPCNETFDNYDAACDAYNSYVASHPGLHYPSIGTILRRNQFITRYCNCGEKFVSILNAIRGGYHPDSTTVFSLIDLDNACATAPCVPAAPDTAIIFPPLAYSPNPCVQQAINIAVLNARNEYDQYIDSMTTDIAARYTEHCLGALENFTYKYTDKEYHFTLYYYDQAGNLVKTIPPEGVQLLDIDATTDALATQIRYDRDHDQQNVFTSHRMATNYQYNSLNQLVYQDMPDHDKLNMIGFTLPNGLDSRLYISRTQFVNASKGYLSGNVAVGTGRSYLYTTDNGGANWRRLYNTVGADLNDVFFASATVGFAAGDNGTTLKTTDGGSTWDEKNIHSICKSNLYAACFSGTSNGVMGGIKTALDSGVYYTSNGGSTYTSGSGFSINDTITDITYDGSNFYATVKNGNEGKIYSSSNAHAWSRILYKRAGDLAKVHYMSHTPGSLFAYAVGVDGTFLKSEVNATSKWNLVATGTAKAFRDVYFKNENEGIAIIDSATNKGQIWKTFDSGHSWELLSDAGDYYNSLQEYDKGKVLASGENGLIAKVLMSAAPFAIVKLQKPSAVNDLQYADAVVYAGNPQTIAVGNTDTLYYKENASAGAPDWTKVKTTTLTHSVSGGDANFKKIQLKKLANSKIQKGALLTQTGKIYRVYKDSLDAFDFAIATVQDLSATPVSSYFFNDITMDTHVSTKFYAFDTISKRAFTGTIGTGTNPTLTFTYTDTVTVQQKYIRSIAVDSAAGNILLAGNKGSIKHKSNANSTTTNYSNRTYGVTPLPLHSISAQAADVLYAAGNDGSIWTTGNGSEWKLLNTGITDKINAISINAGADNGAIACDNGKLYAQTIVDSLNSTFTAVDINTSENLTSLALNDTIAYVGTPAGTIIHVPDLNAGTYSNVNVQYMQGGFNGMALLPSSQTVYAVGDNAAVYECLDNNSARVNDVFLPIVAAVSFANANNGYITSTVGDIRHTSDGGNTWQVVVPTAFPSLINLYTVKPDQAILIGMNKFFAVINGNNMDTVLTVAGGASNVQFINIDFNKNNYGMLIGSRRCLYSLVPSGNIFTVTILPTLPPTVAGTEYTFATVKVFSDNSFLAAGGSGRIFYYKGGNYYRQINYGTFADSTTSIFRDCYFHDDRTCYLVGDKGIALKCTLDGNIMDNGYGNVTNSMIWDTLHLSDPFGIYNSATKSSIDIYTIDFVDRHHGFVGGYYNTAPVNAKYSMLIDDNSGYYSTRFFYDKLGRMVVSQNSKQYNKIPEAFSYTAYDALGRIKEVGEKSENADSLTFRRIFGSYVNNLFNSNTINDDSLRAWIAGDGVRKEVTKTYYDNVNFSLPVAQENLRKRVSDVTYEDVDDNVDSTYQHATHYDYDIHGNVRTLLQDNRKMYDTAVYESSDVALQRFKRIDYEYDLISGKVNRVIYQPDAPDLFIHKYCYDADNRITRVETSTDDIIYDLDAKYYYYAHGPLARVEYGKNQVQGVDYAYTLQGWIKGINSNTLYAGRDMGWDGFTDTTHANFARDAMGYTLGYYAGDYKAIDRLRWNVAGNRFEAVTAGAEFMDERHDLYNGNISHMATTIVQTDTAGTGLLHAQVQNPLANAYKYDQLNRLRKSLSFNNINIPNNLWQASGQAVSHLYENVFTYDPNGNILTQDRYDDAGTQFENMDYRYRKDVSGHMLQNRLYHVNDSASSGLQPDDIDDQGGFDNTSSTMNTANNYGYDEIGNMMRDSTEEIDTIKWTVYGKIKEIKRSLSSSKKNLIFDYDASGNRIAKHVLSSLNNWESSTYYVRDAQGNVMSTYKQEAIDTTMSFKLQEVHLYGSARLGMATPDKEMLNADAESEFAFDTLNKRQYELSNHLGNVLTVIYDRKIAVDTNNDLFVDYRLADLASVSDYSAFGVKLYNRGFENAGYRFGFGGQEKDDEVSGEGNSYTADYWQYDSRLGRRWNVDPFIKAWEAPYTTFANNPIYFSDPQGLTATGPPKEGEKRTSTSDDGEITTVTYNSELGWLGAETEVSGRTSGDINTPESNPATQPVNNNDVVNANRKIRTTIEDVYDAGGSYIINKTPYLSDAANAMESVNSLRKFSTSKKYSDLQSPFSLASTALKATKSPGAGALGGYLVIMEDIVDRQVSTMNDALVNSQGNILNSQSSYDAFAAMANANNNNNTVSDPHNIIMIYSGTAGYTAGDYYILGVTKAPSVPTNYARPLSNLQNGSSYNGFKPNYVIWGYQGGYTGSGFTIGGIIRIQ